MLPGDLANIHYPISPSLISTHNNPLVYHLNGSFDPLYHLQTIQPKGLSSNSTSDEADDQQVSIINERKQRRMISNRESARRSRMRKQKHLDELWSQVLWLRNENNQLINKLNHISEDNERVIHENAQLKEETTELRQIITDMKLNSPFSSINILDEINHDNA